MLFLLWDMELKMESSTGKLRILGEISGLIMDFSRLGEEQMNVALKKGYASTKQLLKCVFMATAVEIHHLSFAFSVHYGYRVLSLWQAISNSF